MRFSRLYAPTLKEVPNDAEVVSHQLLVRAGFIRKLAAGVYDFLPLARRSLKKIEDIIREELDQAGAQEVLLPMVQPSEIWEESGRWKKYGPELLRFKDRKGAEFCLGPTHEEVIVDLVRRDVRSWRSLPLNLYQIQAKFRDEIRPRAGLMRGREFIMKDAYSFDVDQDAALKTYDAMYDAYQRIFTRCGLNFRPVEADTGAIGGSRSHEFQVLAESGEDHIVSCDQCQYAANVEQAELRVQSNQKLDRNGSTLQKIATPNQKSIADVAKFLSVPVAQCIKTLIVEGEGKLYAILMRGEDEVNLIKVKKLLGLSTELEMASDEKIERELGVPVGYIGPKGLKSKVQKIVADFGISGIGNAVMGANEKEMHYVGAWAGEDFDVDHFAELRLAKAGDECAKCETGHLQAFKGIEAGHVFYLGTKYSTAMGCHFLNQAGEDLPIVMGCYGIGVSRVLAAAIEQNHDQDGIIWPDSIAPYTVTILALQADSPAVIACAEQLYQSLQKAGIDTLYDDRSDRAGAKFKDADLIGIPIRIAIGKKGIENGVIEVKRRDQKTVQEVAIDQAVTVIRDLIKQY
jgi:prolyl-tRNA synthetase